MLLLHLFHPFKNAITSSKFPLSGIRIYSPVPPFQSYTPAIRQVSLTLICLLASPKRHASNAQTNQKNPLLPLSTLINRMQRPPPMPMVRTRRTARPSRSITPPTPTPTTPRRTIVVCSPICHSNLRRQEWAFEFVTPMRNHFGQLRASTRRVNLFDCLRMLDASGAAAHVRLEESSFAFVVGLLHFSKTGSPRWSWGGVVEPGDFGVGSTAACRAV